MGLFLEYIDKDMIFNLKNCNNGWMIKLLLVKLYYPCYNIPQTSNSFYKDAARHSAHIIV